MICLEVIPAQFSGTNGSNDFSFAYSTKNARQFCTSLQYPCGLDFLEDFCSERITNNVGRGK